MEKTIGGWAFVIGLILAVIIAIFGSTGSWAIYLLLVLGLIVGLLNINDREVNSFLIAAIAFIFTFTSLSKVAMGIPGIGNEVSSFLELVTAFIAPAAAVVAFKALFAHSKN